MLNTSRSETEILAEFPDITKMKGAATETIEDMWNSGCFGKRWGAEKVHRIGESFSYTVYLLLRHRSSMPQIL